MLEYYRLLINPAKQGESRMTSRRSTVKRARNIAVGLAILAACATPAFAQQLNVICPVQAEWCSHAATEFQR